MMIFKRVKHDKTFPNLLCECMSAPREQMHVAPPPPPRVIHSKHANAAVAAAGGAAATSMIHAIPPGARL